MQGMIWIQTVWHHECIPERIPWKSQFWKKKNQQMTKIIARLPNMQKCYCRLITFTNSLDPYLAWQNAKPDLDPNCLKPWMYSWKNSLKMPILKKNQQMTKKSCKIAQHAKTLSIQTTYLQVAPCDLFSTKSWSRYSSPRWASSPGLLKMVSLASSFFSWVTSRSKVCSSINT